MLYILHFSLKANEQRRAELFAKQGRGQQFSSVKERDTWLKKVQLVFVKIIVIVECCAGRIRVPGVREVLHVSSAA